MRKFLLTPLMWLIILLPIAGRLALHQFDPTFFIVADKQFTDPTHTPFPVSVVDGAGYDGQFYFKTALDLSLPSENGITYDDPIYRKQRIVYPLIAWLAAFGSARMIPVTLIAVNFLSLIFIWLIFYRLCKAKGLPPLFSILPVMYSGLMMGVARDLSEPMETLFVLCLLYFGMSNPLIFSALASLALLTKETTLVFILPISALMVFSFARQKAKTWHYLLIALPFGLLLAWKLFLEGHTGTGPVMHGAFNFTYPFIGIITGFLTYFQSITIKNMLAFGLALFSLLWLIWLIVLVYPLIKTAWDDNFKNRYAEIAWLSWLTFSLFFSSAIYQDDWSFVRLFSTFAGISFFILYQNKNRPGKGFILFSILMYAIMTIRLILRV